MAEEIDPIVISGISGHLPESNNIEEFKQQLFDGIDMVTDDDRRWPNGLYGLPSRTGKLKNLSHFDASFFGVHAKQAQVMDPQLRILLEITHEAMIYAGVNPVDLRGSNIGVFMGSTTTESLDFWNNNPNKINGYGLVGGCRTMLANRISYTFDFTGPSYTVDTACSSSMIVFEQAVQAITSGKCDAAFVGGVNPLLNPNMSLQFQRLGMLNADGKCKSFDASGDGYVRSEAVVMVFLQKQSEANRIYATVLGAKSNTDGNKKDGITFPSGDMQGKLMKGLYDECKIDPAEVAYMEAHGTGTKAGDPQEVNSIVDALCTTNRKSPLMIGSVKSNMGHAEAASGLCSIIKVIIAMESGVIPGNLHYTTPNINLGGILDGKLKVIAENEKWNGGITGINSFGFGGTNVHIILRSNQKQKIASSDNLIPRIITVSGRTEDSVHYFLNKIKENSYDRELYALVDNVHKKNIAGHDYRGFCLIEDAAVQEVGQVTSEEPPIWFVFSGMGSQWPGMAKSLIDFEPFKTSIERSAATLKPHGIDLMNLIISNDETILDNVLNSFVSITSIQIALVDILTLLDIEPDGMIGHSIGEIGCAYADKTLTLEQAVLVAFARGTALMENKHTVGAMAAIGLSWEECKKRIPSDIYAACNNSLTSVTISGPLPSINNFVEELNREGIFAKTVNTAGVAFHCKYIASAGPKLKKMLDTIIPSPKARSPKWISTSIQESAWNTPLAQTSSAAYHVNNLLSPVYFHEATKYIPDKSIVIEIAPHSLLQAILKRSLGNKVKNIGLLKREHPDNLKNLLTNIGKIYNSGGQPNIAALYPSITFPVSKGTPMLSSMIKWNHSTEWPVPIFPENVPRVGELIIEVDLRKEEYKFLSDHIIDGRILFPGTGYLTLVWQTFANLRNHNFEQLPVVFEDIKFLRATIMPLDSSVKFLIHIFEGSGEFEICESGNIVVSGRIYMPVNIEEEFLSLDPVKRVNDPSALPLNKSDIYKILRLRGYENDGIFKGIFSSDNYGTAGILAWGRNWTTFIDTMLQFYYIGQNNSDLYLPTTLHKIIVNPKAHTNLNLDQIPIFRYNDIDVLKCGGIEIRGIKSRLVARRQQTQVPPKLEKYQFVPLESVIPLSEDEEMSTYYALTVASQLVLENFSNDLKLNVVEVITEGHSNPYILPKVQEIMESEPRIIVNATIITSSTIDVNMFEGTSIKIMHTHVVPPSANLIILKGALKTEHIKEIANAVSSLKQGGFILFEETKQNLQLQLLSKHSLEIVSRQVTKNKLYILTRKLTPIADNSIVIEITKKTIIG